MQVDSCKLKLLCAQSWLEPTSTLVVYFLIVYFVYYLS